MILAVPREVRPGERRVAATPETVARLIRLGFDVRVERQAGAAASFADEDYQRAGATVAEDAAGLWREAEIVLKVQPPDFNRTVSEHEADLIRVGAILVCFLWPGKNRELIERLAARNVTAIAMDQVPRITRAQKVDALSSMANIAGYRAVIEAASFYGRFFTGQMTAAGRVPPARVLVIGAGVAGLSAIGAARGLGAIVRAFDTRPAVKEQVESLGAEFIDLGAAETGEGAGGYARQMSDAYLEAERALFAAQCREVDIIITTALVPNRPAPILLTEDMVRQMKRGSVIVDLAAENGGNCALTQPGEVIERYGVHIIGYADLPSRLAPTASHMYGNNLAQLLADMGGARAFHIDLEDEIVRGALVLRDGEIVWPPPARPSPPAPAVDARPVTPRAERATPRTPHPLLLPAAIVFGTAALVGLGLVVPPSFLSHLTVFALACVVGWQVVWNVTPALHTPLMSVTNAISGIILIGGMLELEVSRGRPVVLLGAVAVLLASINVVGGFWVTQRMLLMFRR